MNDRLNRSAPARNFSGGGMSNFRREDSHHTRGFALAIGIAVATIALVSYLAGVFQ